MSKSNEAETNFQKLLFNNTGWANIGDGTGLLPSGTAGSFYISLHTGDPGETGDQTTNEVAYTGYARVAVPRTTGGFTCDSLGGVLNAALITFGKMTGGAGGTVTYFGIGTAASGAGHLIESGGGLNLAVTVNVTPEFGVGQMSSSED